MVLALGWYFYGQPSFRKGDASHARDPAGPRRRTAAPKNSIAVLAFDDLSPAHDQEYFSDGMSEEILNALARVKDLKVIGRSSSFQYKGKNVDAAQVGQALGVAHLLEGSVRRQGDQRAHHRVAGPHRDGVAAVVARTTTATSPTCSTCRTAARATSPRS